MMKYIDHVMHVKLPALVKQAQVSWHEIFTKKQIKANEIAGKLEAATGKKIPIQIGPQDVNSLQDSHRLRTALKWLINVCNIQSSKLCFLLK